MRLKDIVGLMFSLDRILISAIDNTKGEEEVERFYPLFQGSVSHLLNYHPEYLSAKVLHLTSAGSFTAFAVDIDDKESED